MPRSDLVLALARAGAAGDAEGARSAIRNLAAEERVKGHSVLAERLVQALEGRTGRPGEAEGSVAPHSPPRRPQSGFPCGRHPGIRLEDLVLNGSVRRACEAFIEGQLRASVLRARSLDPQRSILLTGPAGNGRSSVAEAVADGLALPFVHVLPGEGAGPRAGYGLSGLSARPCVLFLDRIDLICVRDGGTEALLAGIDRLSGLTVLAASADSAAALDGALLRRFQLRLVLEAPDTARLAEFLARSGIGTGNRHMESARSVAKRLGPVSFAEAEEFCREVRRIHVLGGGDTGFEASVAECLKRRKSLAVREGPSGMEGSGPSM